MAAALLGTGRRRSAALVHAWHLPTRTSTSSIGQQHKHRKYYHSAKAFDGRYFATPTAHIHNVHQRRSFVGTTRCWQQQQKSSSNNDKAAATPIPCAYNASSWEASDWALHVAVSPEDAPIRAVDAIEKALRKFYNADTSIDSTDTNNVQLHKDDKRQAANNQYTAQELLQVGGAWYLPAQDMNNPYKKPTRLCATKDSDFELQQGDYLRVHHNPRRFPAVDLYDWTLGGSTSTNATGDASPTTASPRKEKLIVEYNADRGFLVLNKPAECIPVHSTVDNSAENMVACLKRANPDLDYVTTPHRLDQNTSGLITLATSKTFAAYFAKLMRQKTATEVPDSGGNENAIKKYSHGSNINNNTTGVHKAYRCLVCLMPPPPDDDDDDHADDDKTAWSVGKALRKLQNYASESKVMRHYLEPSIRAPKRFVATLPDNAVTSATTERNKNKTEAGWAECLMRIQQVGDVCALRGNTASDELAQALWQSSQELMPPTCQAVVEVDVELLTGRTHQIRGQLSTEGFPLVGDVPYGGAAVPVAESVSHESKYNSKLALQCSRLEFLDPDVRTVKKRKKRGHVNLITDMVPSTRWNTFQLGTAWWTPFLQQYHEAMKQTTEEEMTTMAALDIGLLDMPRRTETKAVAASELNPQGLPPQANLSPGRHKYVSVKAIDPNTGEIRSVHIKSASPQECGGPFHRDVAADLVEWIEACGYRAVVTGGGRILYQADTKRALVYGFSYGFGRGDHALAAKVIKEWSDKTIDSAYDDSPDLY